MTDRKQDIVELGMLERMARAVWCQALGVSDSEYCWENLRDQEYFRAIARAALMAMRKASEEMVCAGYDAFGLDGMVDPGYVWYAMIEAILADAPPCPSAPRSVE